MPGSMLGLETLLNKAQGLPSWSFQSRGGGGNTEVEPCLKAGCDRDYDGAFDVDTQVLW